MAAAWWIYLTSYMLWLAPCVYPSAALGPASVGETPKCPDRRYCICDGATRSVSCVHLSHWPWRHLLDNIPFNTTRLVVKWSRLDIPETPLPANYTFPHLEQLVMLGVQTYNVRGMSINLALTKAFPNLLHLNVSYSNVVEIQDGTFSAVPRLLSLVLTGNSLVNVPENSFEHLTDLQLLYASFGHSQGGTFLPRGLLSPLVGLVELDLSGGFLEYLHPDTFLNNTNLQLLRLNNNKLQTIQSGIFDTLYNLTNLHIYDNPFECSCELHWLLDDLKSSRNAVYQDIDRITCIRYISPFVNSQWGGDSWNETEITSELLQYYDPNQDREIREILALQSINAKDIPCIPPTIYYWGYGHNISITRTHGRMVGCVADGVPRPFVYWETPVGRLAAPDNHGWQDPDWFYWNRDSLHSFIAPPTFRKAHIEVFNNNSMLYWNMRQYFAGTYSCVAANPLGNATRSFYMAVTTPLKRYMIHSVVFGGLVAAAFGVLSAVAGALKLLMLRHCARFKVEPDFDPTNMDAIAAEYPDYYDIFVVPGGLTPYLEVKCEDDDDDSAENRARVMKQLGKVRERLRRGMERHVCRIRSYGQHMRASSSATMHNLRHSSARYMHNFRDTSNLYMQKIRCNSAHYMHTLRSSSSNYAHRMRAGMALATEQVKNHVQSMREFCGTGDIGQTMSTVSFQTDVDSQTVYRIVSKQTYV